MKVLKFGRSSVVSADILRLVKEIIQSEAPYCIVVVSADEHTSGLLQVMANKAVLRDESYRTLLLEVEEKYAGLTESLVEPSLRAAALTELKENLAELSNTLHGVFLLQELTPKVTDLILSFGARLSALLVSRMVTGSAFFDAREFIKTNASFGHARVDLELTERLIRSRFKALDQTAIVQGFTGSSYRDETTMLGRRGGDYSAALIAAALKAEALELWMNVDGFMTADPEVATRAYPIERLTYAEAIELSHFGTTVIYTPTIRPVYDENIPIYIKNTFNRTAQGTVIHTDTLADDSSSIKGISSINNISLITLQGTRMVGVNDVSERLFRAFNRKGINIILVTQASSEYSMSIAIIPDQLSRAKSAIEEEFLDEIGQKNELRLQIEDNLSIIAIVGEKMKNKPGISATLFNALARNGISVIATAQGSSELNISVVIRSKSLKRAINAIHEGFFLSHFRELHLFVVGIGNVGGSLLRQIQSQQAKLMEELRLKIHVIGLSNSRKMYFAHHGEGVDLNRYKEILQTEGAPFHPDRFVEKMLEQNLRNNVFIDCTSSQAISDLYERLFDHYVSVVTANKIACSSVYSHYRQLKEKAKDKGVRFAFETNVGAGLPIINTLNDLIRSGDTILKIEAVVSGTLNYIFNTISNTIPLSKAIRMAKELGYSEPDPRLDLSGTDVIRKLLILSRESGYPIEKEEVTVNGFLPESCFEGSIDAFWSSVEALDETFEQKRAAMAAKGLKWRYIAKLEEGRPSVGLCEVDAQHPSYNLEGSNNIILITTQRYFELPMVIKGYGAGAEVTAAGVFADLIRVANV